jgi:Uma2 family endonuclease
MSDKNPFAPKPPPGQNELPCDDGEPMETARHREQMILLIHSLEDAWRDRSDFYVSGNMFVYFSELQVKNNDFRGPDVFVVLDTERKERKSWVAWKEGGRLPDVVIELTSETTAHLDRGEKKRIYAKVWRLPEYFIFDPFSIELEGYRLDTDRRDYVPIESNERGDMRVATLGLCLGVRPGRLQLYDGPCLRWLDDQGEPLRTPQERAEHERERAEQAEARLAELTQQMELLRRGS